MRANSPATMSTAHPSVEQLRASIKQIISTVTQLKPEQIDDTTAFDEMGIDSLTAAEIMVHVDYVYKVRIPPEELAAIRNVDDAVVVVQRHLR
jgi:acyl carrier protein